MKSYTHVLWDFNGTILDDVKESLICAERLLRKHGLPPLGSLEAYRHAFGFPIIDYYRRIGFDFSKIDYADLAVEWVDYYREETRHPRLFADVESTLRRFRAVGFSQLILSATHIRLLEEQLETLAIRAYFDELLALDNIHAHSKIDLACAWRREHPSSHPVLIGDTDHDAEAARAMGIDCILVACGHQTKETLLTAGATAVCDSLTQVAGLLTEA